MAVEIDADIVRARQRGRELAAGIGLSPVDQTIVATAISELARNILLSAGRGEIAVRVIEEDSRQGVSVNARDDGPGIADIDLALQDGYSTSGGLGLGLPGVRRLMDEFWILSAIGKGTTVITTKWGR